MEFEELLQYARTYDKKAMMDIIEMYDGYEWYAGCHRF